MAKLKQAAAFLLLTMTSGCGENPVTEDQPTPAYVKLNNDQIAVSIYVSGERAGYVLDKRQAGKRLFGSVDGLTDYDREVFSDERCVVFHLSARVSGHFDEDRRIVIKDAADVKRISTDRFVQLTGYDPRRVHEEEAICNPKSDG